MLLQYFLGIHSIALYENDGLIKKICRSKKEYSAVKKKKK